jgi:hypothetical protein
MAYRTAAGHALGPRLAPFAAGPTFVLMIESGWFAEPARVIAPPASGVTLLVLLVAIPLGGVIAFLPILLGTATMHALGRRNFAATLAPIWAIIGGTAAGAPAPLAGAAPATIAAWAGTGAVCACIARIGQRWA